MPTHVRGSIHGKGRRGRHKRHRHGLVWVGLVWMVMWDDDKLELESASRLRFHSYSYSRRRRMNRILFLAIRVRFPSDLIFLVLFLFLSFYSPSTLYCFRMWPRLVWMPSLLFDMARPSVDFTALPFCSFLQELSAVGALAMHTPRYLYAGAQAAWTTRVMTGTSRRALFST